MLITFEGFNGRKYCRDFMCSRIHKLENECLYISRILNGFYEFSFNTFLNFFYSLSCRDCSMPEDIKDILHLFYKSPIVAVNNLGQRRCFLKYGCCHALCFTYCYTSLHSIQMAKL